MAEVNSNLILDEIFPTRALIVRAYQLLLAAAGATVGNWVAFHMFNKGTIELTGNFVGTAALYGTNDSDPQASDLGTQIGSDITCNGTNQFVYINNTYRFVRLAVKTYTSGQLSAVLQAASGS